jgi:F0F1-type ATP synthase membrane subunit b/b'
MNIKINPIILIFLCYAIGIISLFLPQPLFFGIILLVPAVIGTIYFYAKRIIRIYGEKNAKIQEELNSPISKIQEEPEKIFEQPKVIEI